MILQNCHAAVCMNGRRTVHAQAGLISLAGRLHASCLHSMLVVFVARCSASQYQGCWNSNAHRQQHARSSSMRLQKGCTSSSTLCTIGAGHSPAAQSCTCGCSNNIASHSTLSTQGAAAARKEPMSFMISRQASALDSLISPGLSSTFCGKHINCHESVALS